GRQAARISGVSGVGTVVQSAPVHLTWRLAGGRRSSTRCARRSKSSSVVVRSAPGGGGAASAVAAARSAGWACRSVGVMIQLDCIALTYAIGGSYAAPGHVGASSLRGSGCRGADGPPSGVGRGPPRRGPAPGGGPGLLWGGDG